MKITGNDVDRFLDNPGPDIALTLVYGPDKGLVAERCQRLGKSVVSDLSDPFSVVELSQASIKEDGARLSDEARAISFGGGKRLVRVRGGGDSISSVISDYLSDPASETMVVIDAEEMSPRSSLRKLVEGHDRGMTVPCYTAEGKELEKAVAGILNGLGVSVDHDALSILGSSLGADRGLVHQELEKLALYVGSGNQVTAASVAECLVDSVGISLDQLAYAVGDGNARDADKCLQKAMAEGVSEIAILRSLQRHFLRLEWVVSQAQGGKSVGGLVAGLRPPVFFKMKDRFERQARNWSVAGLHRATGVLIDAEIACKSTGTPVELVCGRAILALCRPG